MRKNKRPELNQVVEDIYDAALNSTRWKDTIAMIAEYVGGQAGGLALKDCQSKNVNVFYDVGFDRECIEVYLQTYSKFDPLATAPLFDLRQIASVPDLMPYDEYLKGRFYREWAQPQGWLELGKRHHREIRDKQYASANCHQQECRLGRRQHARTFGAGRATCPPGDAGRKVDGSQARRSGDARRDPGRT